jgi:ABC-type polar amino acid transport system ATPase subunit
VPSTGRLRFEGRDLVAMGAEERRVHRRDIQMIFQDPLAALNPRMTVGDIIAEPLITHFPQTPRPEVRARVGELMERVGLLKNLVNRYPHEFSGGQCQRIGIARALILRPKLLICDEPVSALDVSVQAQVVNLLRELRREMGIAMLFIAHDLSVVRHISDRVMVMYLGPDDGARGGPGRRGGAQASLHAVPDRLGADPGPRARARAAAPGAGGRPALAAGAPLGLRVPHALPQGQAPLRRGGPAALSGGPRAGGDLPLLGRAHADGERVGCVVPAPGAGFTRHAWRADKGAERCVQARTLRAPVQ